MWYLRFTLRCHWKSKSAGMWRCATGQIGARWSFRSPELLTQWHSVTSHKTAIFRLHYPTMPMPDSSNSSNTLGLFPPKFESWKLKQMSETHSSLTTVPTVQLSNPPRLLTATLSIPRSSWHSMAKKSPTVLLIGRRVNRQRSRRDGSGTVTWGRPLKYSTVTSVRTTGLHLFTES